METRAPGRQGMGGRRLRATLAWASPTLAFARCPVPLTLVLLVLAQGNQSVHDWLEGAEIGDREQSMTFASKGGYRAERHDTLGQTQARGAWKLTGNTLSVTVSSCKGPHCKTFATSFTAEVTVVGERALTVDPTPSNVPFARGSYYCHHQGCEKRIGVRLVAHAAASPAVRAVADRLIDRNVSRNTEVVWWAPRAEGTADASSVLYCPHEADADHKAAETVVADLAGLDWLGPLVPAAATTDCLWDVQVTVGDAVVLPEPAARAAP
jgi:hypothetical protein